MTFYTAAQFPAEYRGQAFAAEHGSWNRARRTGYKVIWLPIVDGRPTGEYVDFMTGMVTPQGNVWGRPVAVAQTAQGALVVSDDAGNCLWRIRYVRGAR
jgi:glucose/arabinose dehydrogenase